MLKAFTRNYHDNSTESGFEFTFYCDICNDGYKSSFVQSTTAGKGKLLKGLGAGAGIVGSLVGGRGYNVGWAADRGSDVLAERFDGRSPQWMKEHEQAFERAQNEAKQHFHRCPNCTKYVCDACWNESTGLCTACSPRQEVYVAQAHAQAMKRNIDEAGQNATVWQGEIESKVTICPVCGKPAGTGKHCNNCGALMDMSECPQCGAKNAPTVKYCNNCGLNLAEASVPAVQPGKCPKCGVQNPPGTKFCGECGTPL